MSWLARHDPVIDWAKRTIVRFRSSGTTESDGPVGAAHAPRGACDPPPEAARGAPDTKGSELDASAPGADAIGPNVEGRSAIRGRRNRGASAPGADAASSADGGKRPALEMLACSRAAGLHDEAIHNQAGLDCVVDPTGDQKKDMSTAGPRQNNTRGTGFRTRSERCKRAKLRKSWSGADTLPAVSTVTTQRLETINETLRVLTHTDTGHQYRKIALESPPTLASELTSLPAMSWKRFARDLHDGRIEQICIRSDVARMKCDAEGLKQLVTEGADTLSAKSKKERFNEESWDSLKSSPLYEVLREYKYWPLPREQVNAIDDFSESRRKAGQVRESKSPHSVPTFCVKKAQGGWRIVHAYNKLNDATVTAQTPIPRTDVIIDSMALSTIFRALDQRDGFYQILMRGRDIPLTAVSTPSGMLWEWLVVPQGLKNAPATFNRCVTHLLRSVRDFATSYFDDVFIHSRTVNGKLDVEMHKEHLRKPFTLMRKHKLYANLKKCIFGASEIPVLACLVGKNGVRPDPGKVRVINECQGTEAVPWTRDVLVQVREQLRGQDSPLSQLLKKDAAWNWTAECQAGFD
ncbi:unnamed protein product [Phytophthora fragariaefolia]|uniref:Unnamed protein product n=1 Tax=Phytophthora fragariaefolia TaxID=1490495 RepID=A0A9W6YC78_9STRA|nr:unnamed protein product [Phytophthora fragariaefolia]